ncbi:MAG TPA: hypothetical protein V6D22_01395 [Candidatus Obscuribacterales bacterium]
MAQLMSEEVDTPSILMVSPGPKKQIEDQDWQYVTIDLISGRRDIHTLENEDVLVCRRPTDEIVQLVEALAKLVAKDQDQVIFEPSEPSFELSFSRTRRGGIKVEAWLDAGNGISGICTWDAAGIRFYTNEEHLTSFVKELAQDFQVGEPKLKPVG